MQKLSKPKFVRPELLLPAGNMEKLRVGLQYGGGAFYMGFTPFSLRANDNGFTKESLLEGVNLIRKAGKVFYMTMNLYPRSEKMDILKKQIEFVRKEVKPDAIIVADPGLFEMLREYYPEAILHMSVQANILNYRSVDFWRKQGAKRIILPRELTLKDIRDIHKHVPNIELEFFVHGAICMAYSGRCMLSNYMTGRDSNQGACSHSCRWKYKVLDEEGVKKREKKLAMAIGPLVNPNSKVGHMAELNKKSYYLEEEKRPGQFYKIEEDENGTYFMNSKDNCLLPYLRELVEAGVCSFKVEGRNKTEYYLATVAKVYKLAIDDMMCGRKFNEALMEEIWKTANRGFIPGYLFGYPEDNDVFYQSSALQQNYKFVGMVMSREAAGLEGGDLYEVSVRNRLNRGEEVEIMTPDGQFTLKVEEMFDLEGRPVEAVHGGAGSKILKLRKNLSVGSMLRVKCV